MRVPFLDLHAANRRHERAFFLELRRLYRQSAFIGGPWLAAFEQEFAQSTGAAHCVAVASGTAALHLSLAAANVGPGDEVILPAFTFPGTAWGILYLGAKPVFADVRLRDGCLDPESVAGKITRRTRAIIAVHLFGHPAPLNALREIARGRRIVLLEDAAQAHGGGYRGRALGSVGDFGCFSFYPTKNLGGLGDGGAILVKLKSVAERLRRLRDHGQRRRFFPEETGYNARMDAIQALFLRLKLPFLQADNERRTAIAARYIAALENHEGLAPLKPATEGRSAWHCFTVRAKRRSSFLRFLEARGIGHQVYYPAALPSLKPLKAYARGSYPAAEELARSCVALPLYPDLKASGVAAVVKALREIST
jgi:dTDP-4-amino-4,6-dideoxygalactose transaminase